MGITGADGGQPDPLGVGVQRAGPTVTRMLVGAQLRRLREAAGITRARAGFAIRASESKISRMELGRSGFKPRDISDLLTLYGVSDGAERATMLALASQASTPGWWHAYGDVVPSWFEPYLGLEQGASVIRGYEPQFIPGLLQTRDYARAVIGLNPDDVPADQLERRVSLRMRRQQLLSRPAPPRLWAVVDEAALRRPFGGTEVMRAQLRKLIDAAALPHVSIQVMPFSAGGHAAAGGAIALLRFPEVELPDVVYLEQLGGARYPEKPAETLRYWNVLNRLVTDAEAPASSLGILRAILGGR